jgi:hypothetical protein
MRMPMTVYAYINKIQDVYTVATLMADLTDVPLSEFKRMKSPSGLLYYLLDFQIEITIQSALEFSLNVDGKKYGAITATYQ